MKQDQTHTTDNSADHARQTDQAVADRQDGAKVEPAVVDVEQIEQMGRDVIDSVQCLHELLVARSEALEACRSAVVEQATELEQQQQAFAGQENQLSQEFEARQAQLVEREKQYEQIEERCQEIKNKQQQESEELIQQQQQLDKRQAELSSLEKQLHAQQAQLEQQQKKIAAQEDQLSPQREQLKTQESQLSEQTIRLDQRSQHLDEKQQQLADLEQQWKSKIAELNAAGKGLAAVQQQLQEEMKAVASQESQLLPEYGLTDGVSAGQKADADMPSAAQDEARKSIERFQKLCRDAKRRVIGED